MILNFVQPILFCIPKSTKYTWTSRRLSTTCIINTIFHFFFSKPLKRQSYFQISTITDSISISIVILHVKLPFCLYGKTINIISLTIFDRKIETSYSLSLWMCNINWRQFLQLTTYYIGLEIIKNEAQTIYHKKS